VVHAGFAYEEKVEETVSDISSTPSCENVLDSQCDLLKQAMEETFGTNGELLLSENDVMDINPNSPTEANNLQNSDTEILQPSCITDEDESHFETSSSNVDNLDNSKTEELSFLWAQLSLGEQENVSLGGHF